MKKGTKMLAVSALLLGTVISGYSIFNTASSASSIEVSSKSTAESEGQILRNKMLNAVDNYDYAKGTFTSTNSGGEVTIVDFEVQQGKNPGSQIIISDKNNNPLLQKISNAEQIVIKNDMNKTFTKTNKVKWLAPSGPRKGKAEDGHNTYIYRQDPASAGQATAVTFPQEVAFWLDDEESNYSITGHTKLFERNATIIEGVMLKSMKSKAEKFVMYVDTETGILLGLETFRVDGTPSLGVKIQNIEIDQKPTNKLFDISKTEGYQEVKLDDHKKLVEGQNK